MLTVMFGSVRSYRITRCRENPLGHHVHVNNVLLQALYTAGITYSLLLPVVLPTLSFRFLIFGGEQEMSLEPTFGRVSRPAACWALATVCPSTPVGWGWIQRWLPSRGQASSLVPQPWPLGMASAKRPLERVCEGKCSKHFFTTLSTCIVTIIHLYFQMFCKYSPQLYRLQCKSCTGLTFQSATPHLSVLNSI